MSNGISNDLEVLYNNNGNSCDRLQPFLIKSDRKEIWKFWFLRRTEKNTWVVRDRNLSKKEENKQQTKPACVVVHAGIRAGLVARKRMFITLRVILFSHAKFPRINKLEALLERSHISERKTWRWTALKFYVLRSTFLTLPNSRVKLKVELLLF